MTDTPKKGLLPRLAACRSAAVALLTLGALLAATVPNAQATTVCVPATSLCVTPTLTCDPTHPTTCCPNALSCNVNCTPTTQELCCLLQNPTNPQACTTIGCGPAIQQACCVLDHPTNPSVCTPPPPCDPTHPTTCCPPTILTCNIGCTNLTAQACCLLNNPTNPQACVRCTVNNPQVCCLQQNPTNPQACVICTVPTTNPLCNPPPPPQCQPGSADLDGDCDCGTEPGDPADACVPPPPSATCLADGILVTATDITGGDTRSAYSESVAAVTGSGGAYTPPPTPGPQPPASPQAHADAHQATFHYDNSLVTLDAQAIHSRCDVDSNSAGFTDAYGRGGVADLQLKVLGQVIHLDALDYEEQARGTPGVTTADWSCDTAEVELNPPPAVTAICQNLALSAGVVTVILDEHKAPVWDAAASEWIYEGSQVHVNVVTLAATVDLYVGYVRVGVTGGPALLASYTGHTCILPSPLCS